MIPIYLSATNNKAGSGSIGLLYRSKSIQGPWTRQIISAYSCNGQVEGVLPLTDPTTNKTSYVWHSTSVPGGPRVGWTGHIFQPLHFNSDSTAQDLDCAADASFSVALTKGTGVVASGNSSTATDGSPTVAGVRKTAHLGFHGTDSLRSIPPSVTLTPSSSTRRGLLQNPEVSKKYP